MFLRPCLAISLASVSLAAVPGMASAATHEPVTYAGKSVVAYRPVVQQRSAPAKCHPDAHKAMVCEAQAAIARQQAMAADRAASDTRLSQR